MIWRKPKPMTLIVVWDMTVWGCTQLAPTKDKWKLLEILVFPGFSFASGPFRPAESWCLGVEKPARTKAMHLQWRGGCFSIWILQPQEWSFQGPKEAAGMGWNARQFPCTVAEYRPESTEQSTNWKLKRGLSLFYQLSLGQVVTGFD